MAKRGAKRTTGKRRKCQGTTSAGKPCKSPAVNEDGWCWAHDPSRARERAEARRKGGEHRASLLRLRRALPGRLETVAGQLEDALGEVLGGELEPSRATAAASLGRAIVNVLEGAELEERVRALEERLGQTPEERTA